MILPIGDILQTRGSVGALGGVDAGGNLLRNGRVDVVVDKDDVNGGCVSAIMGLDLAVMTRVRCEGS